MHIAVLGAGVVGTTTAHYLASNGHEVTVVERASTVAEGCSHANGAQLSYSYTDAMASPSFLLRLPRLLAGLDPAIRVRPPLDSQTLRWASAFLGQCTSRKAAANTRANLALAARSMQLLRELSADLPGTFAFRKAGKLVLLRTARELADARSASEIKSAIGLRADVISIDEAAAIEPAVRKMPGPYVGAVYSAGDDVGDARLFTIRLADRLIRRSRVRFLFNTTVQDVACEDQRVVGVRTNGGDIEADAVIVCLGSWSRELLANAGVEANILPVRGYSVTLPPGTDTARVSITDFGRRFVISRLDDSIRIAGFADFVGFSNDRDDARVRRLLESARRAAPGAADYDATNKHAWGGNRPLTPDGRPLVGPTHRPGLYLNTGHGSLGWTLACASAEKIAQLISSGDRTALAA